MCWRPLDTPILKIRTAAALAVSAVIPWSMGIVRVSYRWEAWDTPWVCILRKPAIFILRAFLLFVQERTTSASISLLKTPDHTLVGEMHEKNQKTSIWFGSYSLSVLSYYRSLISWTCAKAVFAGDFVQPWGLILKAGPETGWGL